MLRKLVFAAMFFFMFIMVTETAYAVSAKPITVFLDNKKITFDVQPEIINGRTMVPLKGIFDTLHILLSWDQNTQTITGTKEDTVIKLTVNKSTAYVNGKAVELDSPAVIKNGRTLVPLRFIAQAAESRVIWDSTTRQACIYFNTLAPDTGNITGNIHEELNIIERDGYTYRGGEGIIQEKDGVYIKHITFGKNLYLNMTSQYFFYSNPSDNYKIYRLNIDGTNSTAFKGTEASADLLARDGYIYYVNSTDKDSLYRIKSDGTGIQKLNDENTVHYEVMDDYIYYLDYADRFTNIYRVNKDGTGKFCLYEGVEINDMLVTGGGVYFSNADGLSVINHDGSGYKLISKDVCKNLNIKGNKIYYLNASDNYHIYSITTNKNTRAKVNNETSANLSILGEYIYYNAKDENYITVIKKMKIGTLPKVIIPVSENQHGKYLGSAALNPELNYRNYTFNSIKLGAFKKDAVVLGDWVYYVAQYTNLVESGYQIDVFRTRLDGTGSKMLITHTETRNNLKYSVVGEWIYYLSDNYLFMKVKTDGTQEQVIKCLDINTNDDRFGDTFIVDGDWIYYQYRSVRADTVSLCKMKTDGSQSEKIVDMEAADLSGIANNILYASKSDDKKVFLISAKDKAIKEVKYGLWLPEFNVNSIPEGNLYTVKYNNEKKVNELYCSSLTGKNERFILALPDTTIHESFNLIDNYFYYQTNDYKFERIKVNYQIKPLEIKVNSRGFDLLFPYLLKRYF